MFIGNYFSLDFQSASRPSSINNFSVQILIWMDYFNFKNLYLFRHHLTSHNPSLRSYEVPLKLGPIFSAVFDVNKTNRQAVQMYANRLSSTIGGNREMDQLYTTSLVSNITKKTKFSHII